MFFILSIKQKLDNKSPIFFYFENSNKPHTCFFTVRSKGFPIHVAGKAKCRMRFIKFYSDWNFIKI